MSLIIMPDYDEFIAPPFIPSGMLAHLKGDAGVTLSGGNVSIWADQSGNGHDFNQTNAGQRPLFIASDSGIGNESSIEFDSANTEFLENVSTVPGIENSTNFSAFFVVNPLGDLGNEVLYGEGKDGSNYDVTLRTNNGTDFESSNATGSKAVISASTNTWVIITVIKGGNRKIYKNGVVGATTGGLDANQVPVDACIGALCRVAGGIGDYWNGRIAELILYGSALSAQDQANAESALSTKYGI